jgi:molecular chaperone DnaK
VTFDIDANGIVEVSAKDQTTGKVQSIRITSSSGLTQEEIDRLVLEAERHASEDKRRKELVEAKNQADALIYSTEKSLNELRDRLAPDTIGQVETAVNNLKTAMKGEDLSAIRSLTDSLTQASHQLAASAYGQSGPGRNQHAAESGPDTAGNHGSNARTGDEEIVDAEYQEVA